MSHVKNHQANFGPTWLFAGGPTTLVAVALSATPSCGSARHGFDVFGGQDSMNFRLELQPWGDVTLAVRYLCKGVRSVLGQTEL